MADEKILFAADLDTKKFTAGAKDMLGQLDDIANAGRFGQVFAALGKFGPIFGIISAAAVGAKVAFDAILETEKIERVNRQWTMMAGQVGQYGDKLADALSVAVAGTRDMDDVLEVASRNVVALGDNAGRLPEIYELSRKVVKLYGGDVLETFESMSNAIAKGQTRWMAQHGIIVDAKKAVRDYAESIGVSEKALTDMQKKQALANASIAAASQSLKGVDLSSNDFQTTLEKLQTSLGDLAEVFTVAIGQRAKPVFQGFLDTVTDGVNWLTKKTSGFFQDTTEGTANYIADTKAEITELENTIAGYEKSLGRAASYMSEYREAVNSLARAKEGLAEAEKRHSEQMAAQEAQAKAAIAAGQGGAAGPSAADLQAAKQNQIIIEQNANQQILALREARISAEMQVETNALAMDQLFAQQKVVIEQQLQSQITELRAQLATHQLTGEAEYQAKKVELEAIANAQLAALRNERLNGELNALNNLATAQQRTSAGFSAGFAQASKAASQNVFNFANLGKSAFSGLQGTMMAGYDALASGSEDAGEAMKKFFIGAIADKAAAAGAAMVLESIWPPNPVAAAGGVALMALAGNLKRLAGGGGSSVSMPSAPAAAAAESPAAGSFGGFGSSMAPEPAGPERKRAVTVQIAGNYLDTEQSRRYLLEMIRAETDATDFRYQQIGGIG